jgi:hypothetical protein
MLVTAQAMRMAMRNFFSTRFTNIFYLNFKGKGFSR